MAQLDAVVEDGGLAEDQVVCADTVVLLGILAAGTEPHEVHDARAVAEMGDDALFTRTHLEGLKAQDMADDLHERHVARQLVDGVHLRAVHVLVREVFQQVAKGLDAQLVAEYLLAVGAYARQVHDVLVEYGHSDEYFGNL